MKKLIIPVLFQLLSIPLLSQQDFDIPRRFELNISAKCPQEAITCNYNYGLTPRLNEYGDIDEIWTKGNGKFMSFYYVLLSGGKIDTLHFDKAQNIDYCDGIFASVNIGFYGVYPNKYFTKYIFPSGNKFKDTKGKIQVPQLLKELIKSGDFLDLQNLGNIKLIIVDAFSQNGRRSNPNESFRRQKLKILSRFFYILWDTKRIEYPPEVLKKFKNYCYVLPLFNNQDNNNLITKSEIKKEKNITNNNFEPPNIENKKLKTQIRNYFNSYVDGIEILNDNYRIEFPEIKGEIILHGLKTNPQIQQDPYRLNLEPKKIEINLVQQINNRRDRNKEDPEVRKVLLDKVNNDIVFSLNGRTNINDVNIKYFPLDHSLQYPKIYSEPKQIIIKPKNNDYFEISDNIFNEKTNSLRVPVKFKKDTLILNLIDIDGNKINNDFEVEIYYNHWPLIKTFTQNGKISGLYCHKDIKYKLKLIHDNFKSQKIITISKDDFLTSKTIQLKQELVEFYIELFESKKFNHILNFPKNGLIIKKSKHKLPMVFNLPDSLNQYWRITSMTKDRKLEEGKVEIKKISICRRIIKKDVTIGFFEDKPDEKIDYKILAFNPDESKEGSLNILNKETEQFQLEFPPNPTKGDSLKIVFKKPFGYNIVIGDEHPINYNWQKSDIVLDFTKEEYSILNFSKLNPIQLFYIDVSNSKDKPCFINVIKNKISEFEKNEDDFIIYISNNNNPVVVNSQKGNLNDIIAITQLNPVSPNPQLDIELFSDYITKGRRNIVFNFLISKQQFNYSLDQLIGGTLKEIYDLYGIGIGNNTLNILKHINDNKQGNVSVCVYTTKLNNNEIFESENFKIKNCNNY
ncbi:MAG: hypothetical protein K8R58_04355 [Bacteroidales bacterium]|nr:hypothetical protein [Bacteroidales bacterium]